MKPVGDSTTKHLSVNAHEPDQLDSIEAEYHARKQIDDQLEELERQANGSNKRRSDALSSNDVFDESDSGNDGIGYEIRGAGRNRRANRAYPNV